MILHDLPIKLHRNKFLQLMKKIIVLGACNYKKLFKYTNYFRGASYESKDFLQNILSSFLPNVNMSAIRRNVEWRMTV